MKLKLAFLNLTVIALGLFLGVMTFGATPADENHPVADSVPPAPPTNLRIGSSCETLPPPGPPPSHAINTWVKFTPNGQFDAPGVGWEASGAYDPFNELWLHHAGHDGDPQGIHTFVVDGVTWEWTQRFPADSPSGACVVDGAGGFDIHNRRFVRFPGAKLGHGSQYSRGVFLKNSAVWLYDATSNQWTNSIRFQVKLV